MIKHVSLQSTSLPHIQQSGEMVPPTVVKEEEQRVKHPSCPGSFAPVQTTTVTTLLGVRKHSVM